MQSCHSQTQIRLVTTLALSHSRTYLLHIVEFIVAFYFYFLFFHQMKYLVLLHFEEIFEI